MATFVFYLFAAAAVLGAAMCVLQRSPVASAIWLMSTMFSLAAIFILLNAQLIGILQILVYVGAVLVLFLFVVMLLNLGTAGQDMRGPPGIAATVNMMHIKRHYYESHARINPSGIVPLGPALDFDAPHTRG